MQRLSDFKKLMGPLSLQVQIGADRTSATLDVAGTDRVLPRSLAASEMVFLTKLLRMGTRQEISPVEVVLGHELVHPDIYQEYFGNSVKLGKINRISFSAEDARQPFLTENVRMWESFEPVLKKRLSDLEQGESTAQRVKSALLEMLPSGETSMDQAARRLAISKRTLQRRLNGEGRTYQAILQFIRQKLAQHYLGNSAMSPGEISFLLGFRDSNSFIRAYSSWTGKSPGQFREIAAKMN